MPFVRSVSPRFSSLRSARLTARRGLFLLPMLALAAPAARADVYHAVSSGDTLQSIANKYHVSAAELRLANGLKEGDQTPLGAMLLRVPTSAGDAAADNDRALAALSSGFGQGSFAPARTAPNGSGVVSKTIGETVREGDTWEKIAARYRAMGNDVSVDSLRKRNGWSDLPAPGETVIVPLGQVSYSAPHPIVRPSVAVSAQTAPRVISPSTRSPRALDGGVLTTGDIDLPTASDNTPTQPPVFRAGTSSAPRRGSTPASRGGYGQMGRTAQGGQVRILGKGEEADAPPASNRARITQAPAPRAIESLAKVASVRARGASIRRLPQASAQTLYRCAIGTQLAVLRENRGWAAILMNNNSIGWVPTKYIAMTAQTVDVSAHISSSDPGGSVGGYGGNYDENPIVANALTWLGTRYVYGGTSRRGIDCSSLVQHAFAANGYRLPRTAAQQATVGTPVEHPEDLRAGDRVYFSASGTRIDHTGLYMGNGLFVHASGSGRQVMVSNLFTPRNWNIYVGARR